MGWDIGYKIKSTFLDPEGLFKRADKERGIGASVLWLFGAIILNLVIQTLIYLLAFQGTGLDSTIQAMMIYGINIVMSFVGVFIGVLILHFFIRMFKGKSDISTTFKITAYALAPYFIISYLPYVGEFAVFFSVWLAIFGTWKLHRMTPVRAALAILVPVLSAYIIASIIITQIAMAYLT